MSVIQLLPIVKSVKELKSETQLLIKSCETIQSMKYLCQVYDILEITDSINMKFNNPIKKEPIYDVCALTDMRTIIGKVWIADDPKRYLTGEYFNKSKKLIHYYLHWKDMYVRNSNQTQR